MISERESVLIDDISLGENGNRHFLVSMSPFNILIFFFPAANGRLDVRRTTTVFFRPSGFEVEMNRWTDGSCRTELGP